MTFPIWSGAKRCVQMLCSATNLPTEVRKKTRGSSKIVRCVGAAVKSDGHPAAYQVFLGAFIDSFPFRPHWTMPAHYAECVLHVSPSPNANLTIISRTLHAHFCTTVSQFRWQYFLSAELILEALRGMLSLN